VKEDLTVTTTMNADRTITSQMIEVVMVTGLMETTDLLMEIVNPLMGTVSPLMEIARAGLPTIIVAAEEVTTVKEVTTTASHRMETTGAMETKIVMEEVMETKVVTEGGMETGHPMETIALLMEMINAHLTIVLNVLTTMIEEEVECIRHLRKANKEAMKRKEDHAWVIPV